MRCSQCVVDCPSLPPVTSGPTVVPVREAKPRLVSMCVCNMYVAIVLCAVHVVIQALFTCIRCQLATALNTEYFFLKFIYVMAVVMARLQAVE